MNDLEKHIDKVLSYKTWSDRKKKDELYRVDCKMYTNLGTDSTKAERAEVKRKSRLIYKAIQKIDQHEGTQLLQAIYK